MSDSQTVFTPKLAALLDAQDDAEWRLAEAVYRFDHVIECHGDNDELCRDVHCELADTRSWFVYTATLVAAQELREGHACWSDSLEARAYLEALRTIVEHLEQACTAGTA